jgi:hypothetical protein
VVRPGSNGKIAIYNNAGTTHIIATAVGYFRTSTGSGGGFVPTAYTKMVDTRDGTGTAEARIAANTSRTVQITGAVIPAGTTTVLANVVVANPGASGWLGAMASTAAPAHSALNFAASGTHSHTVSLPLSATGQVVFSNRSAAAIDLVVVPYGYITTSATTGAGYRYVPTTRIYDSGTTLAANASVDVQVAGKLGMPTRGIAGAVLSITANGPSVAGAARAWPSGGTDPSVSQVHFRAGKSAAGLAIIPLGTNGSVRIKNASSGTARIIVDFEGYFANPIPTAPLESYTPSVGLQTAPVSGASLGMVEYAYTDNLGRVLIGHQSDVDNFGSVQWTVISGNEAFSGRPSLALLGDGKAQVGVRYSDSDVWSRTQSAVGSTGWNPWADFGGSMAAAPAITKLPNGVMAAFAVDVDGKLWTYQQTGTIPYWKSLVDLNFTGTPVIAATRTGVQLFIRDTAGNVQTAHFADNVLGAWTNLGGSGTTLPATVVFPGFRIRVFIQQADGTIATKIQDVAGTFPAAWTSLGTTVAAGAPAAVLDPVLGRSAVVTRDTTGQIMLSWETSQGTGIYGPWAAAIPDSFEAAATDPTIVPITNTSGQTWVILFRNENNANRVYERQPIGGLAARSSLDAQVAGGIFIAQTLPAPPA